MATPVDSVCLTVFRVCTLVTMTPTTLQPHRSVPVVLGILTLALGFGLGYALPPLVGLLRTALEASPFPTTGLVRLIAETPFSWSVPIMSALGLIAGVYIANAAIKEALHLVVADDHVEYQQNNGEGWISHADTSAIYFDAQNLIFLDPKHLIRHRLNADALPKRDVIDALQDHDYPFYPQDPFEDAYLRWIDGRPEFTDQEHRLLRRRNRLTKDPGARTDVDELLQQHGIVVRQHQNQLQVRRAF